MTLDLSFEMDIDSAKMLSSPAEMKLNVISG
jgi:hypothetical protein